MLTKPRLRTRRSFLKQSISLGSALWALKGGVAAPWPAQDSSRSRVVIARDGKIRTAGSSLDSAELAKLLGLAAATRALKEKGKVAVLDRDRWPERCERRVKSGLRAVRKIVEERTE